ncbi:MAG: GNAT family N-acetyltransferase, partial [Candidatus Omnitrophota bacterium]
TTIAEEAAKYLSENGIETIIIPLDIFLRDRTWRLAIQKLVTGMPLTDAETLLLGDLINTVAARQQYLDEEEFFNHQRILGILEEINQFRNSDASEYVLHVENAYDQKTKKTGARDFTLRKNMAVIFEGKYANEEMLLPYYDLRYRLHDALDRTKARFEIRSRKLSPDDADMQIVFYDMSLMPSYEIYDRRTEVRMHGFIDLRGEDWFLQKGRAVSSSVGRLGVPELDKNNISERLVVRAISVDSRREELAALNKVFQDVHFGGVTEKAEYLPFTYLAEDKLTHEIIGGFQWIPREEYTDEWAAFVVSPRYQRMGVGRILFGKLVEIAKEMGLKRIWIESRERAFNFYAKLGAKLATTVYPYRGENILLVYDLEANSAISDKDMPLDKQIPASSPVRLPVPDSVRENTKFQLTQVMAIAKDSVYAIQQTSLGYFENGQRETLVKLFQELNSYTRRGPPFMTLVITSNYAFTDGNITRGDANSKTLYIHPYFFNLTESEQLQMLNGELDGLMEQGLQVVSSPVDLEVLRKKRNELAQELTDVIAIIDDTRLELRKAKSSELKRAGALIGELQLLKAYARQLQVLLNRLQSRLREEVNRGKANSPIDGIVSQWPTIALLLLPQDEWYRLEIAEIAKSWYYLSRFKSKPANVIVIYPEDIIIGKNGAPHVGKAEVAEGYELQKVAFPQPIPFHYLYGFTRLWNVDSKTIIDAIKRTGLPCDSNRRIQDLDNAKEGQVELAITAGIPTKNIVAREVPEYSIMRDERIASITRALEANLRLYGKLFVQPANLSRRIATFILSSMSEIPAAAELIYNAVNEDEGQPLARQMLIQEYIPSIQLSPEVLDALEIPDVSFDQLINDLRIVVAYNDVTKEYKVGAKAAFVAREINRPHGTQMEARRAHSIDACYLRTLPLELFLSYCLKDDESSMRLLNPYERHSLEEKIANKAIAYAEAARERGYLSDALAVDFIVSRRLDKNGVPIVYFIEAAAHFSGEDWWNQNSVFGTFRDVHFDAAHARALQYKNKSEGKKPLSSSPVFDHSMVL